MFRNEMNFIISNKYNLVFEKFKPKLSCKFLPQWFKNLPNSIDMKSQFNVPFEIGTVKTCPGIRHTLTNGIILPAWTDLSININPDGSWAYFSADSSIRLTDHLQTQFFGFKEKFAHIKIENPWRIKTKKIKYFYMTSPFYQNETDYEILPGIIEFYYQHVAHINLFFPKKNETYNVRINAGDPLVQLIDTSNDKLPLRYEMVSNDDLMNKYSNKKITFLNTYKLLTRSETK